MFKDLRMKERQKPWLASRAKTSTEDIGDERISSEISERRGWPRSHDVLAIARTASGL